MLAMSLPAGAQVDVGLSPMRLDFTAEPGRGYSGSLTLTNSGSTRTRIRAEILDFYVDESTTPQFVPKAATEDAHSCRSWLSLNPMEMELEPLSRTPVRYTLRVPAGASERGYHCALGFSTFPSANANPGSQMRTAVRLISVFYPVIGRPAVAGEINELKLERSGAALRGVVVMENSGVVLYRPAGTLEVLDSAGVIVASEKLPSFPALPMRRQRYVAPLKTPLAPGKYTLRARVDVGSEIQEASTSVTVDTPPALTAAAGSRPE